MLAAVAFDHIWRSSYANLGQFDEAWRCVDEAMNKIETTKETWFEAESQSHRRRNRV